MEELQINFQTKEALISFCKWLEQKGFENFITSDFNTDCSCLATCEYPEDETDDYLDVAYIEIE